jgi:hypothetical protein
MRGDRSTRLHGRLGLPEPELGCAQIDPHGHTARHHDQGLLEGLSRRFMVLRLVVGHALLEQRAGALEVFIHTGRLFEGMACSQLAADLVHPGHRHQQRVGCGHRAAIHCRIGPQCRHIGGKTASALARADENASESGHDEVPRGRMTSSA